MTIDEFYTLKTKILSNDEAAFSNLISELEGDINYLISSYTTSLPSDELRQEAYISIFNNISKVSSDDPDCELLDYVKSDLDRFVSEEAKYIKEQNELSSNLNKIIDCENALLSTLKREPTIDEVASALGFGHEYLEGLKEYAFEVLGVKEDPHHTLLSTVVAKASTTSYDDSDLSEIMDDLDQSEKTILSLYYGLNGQPKCEIAEIAKMSNTTEEQIELILDKIHKRIKEIYKNEN